MGRHNSYKGVVYKRGGKYCFSLVHYIYKFYFSFNSSLYQRLLSFQIKRGVQNFCTLWLHKGEGVRTFEFFPMHIDSRKFKIFSLIHRYRHFFHDSQHQFCQERTLILQLFCLTRLPQWRFCGWRIR